MLSKMMIFQFIYIILLSIPLNDTYQTINGKSFAISQIEKANAFDDKISEDFRLFLLGITFDHESIMNSEISIDRYFGTYNDCEVVYMRSPLSRPDMMRYVGIAGLLVVYPDYHEVYVYKDSMFYTIKEAYDNGFISKSDVYDIAIKISPDRFKEANNIP